MLTRGSGRLAQALGRKRAFSEFIPAGFRSSAALSPVLRGKATSARYAFGLRAGRSGLLGFPAQFRLFWRRQPTTWLQAAAVLATRIVAVPISLNAAQRPNYSFKRTAAGRL